MADDTQVTETTAPVEEKKGKGASGLIGGVAGGVGAFVAVDNIVANKGIKAVINPEAAKEVAKDAKPVKAAAKAATKEVAKEAKEPAFKKMVDAVLKKDKKIAANKEGQDILNSVKDTKKLGQVEFIADGEKGLHTMDWKIGKTINGVDGVTLPKGVTAGKKLTGAEATKAFEGVRNSSEKALIKDIRKSEGFFAGVKNASAGNKAIIIGATLVGAYAGSKVFHAIFGGKHTKDVQNQAQQETGQARA